MATMNHPSFTTRRIETARHRTTWIEAGPADGPLLVFAHGWPELSIIWRPQIEHFAAAGWRCVAPDMRGYGGSAVPTSAAAYAIRETVADMIELHDALGGAPAVWVGHDWGCPTVWGLASHHPQRCRGVVNLTVPYFARGFAMPNFVPLVDRKLYPEDKYPVGQWDYWLWYREHFGEATSQFEANLEVVAASFFRRGTPSDVKRRALSAEVRAQGGWLSAKTQGPKVARDTEMLSPEDYSTIVAALRTTGLRGGTAWYLNDLDNLAYANEAPNFGRLTLPVLFLHAAWDQICSTAHSRLADPMREDCLNLTEVTIEAGHGLMLEAPAAVNQAIADWLTARDFC